MATPHIYTLEKNWDYRQPAIYFVTFTVRGRRPLLGTLVGGVEEARVEPTGLGWSVTEAFKEMPKYHPELKVLGRMIMPDHFHAIIQVTAPMSQTLGQCIQGFKIACNRAWRKETDGDNRRTVFSEGRHRSTEEAVLQQSERSTEAAVLHQSEQCSEHKGGLFDESFFPRRLMGRGQLQAMFDYMRDNPRRLAVKQSAQAFFRIQREMPIAGYTMDAIGNSELLKQQMIAVHVRRHWTEEETRQFKNRCILEARKGTVLISPFISADEMAVRDVALREGLRLIVICDHGFGELHKPNKMYFDACAEGRVLLLSPWPYQQVPDELTRAQCVAMNEMAEKIAGRGESRRTVFSERGHSV